MPSGRQRRILGEKYVINLNNKGGVRKSPRLSPFHKCMRKYLNKNIQRGKGTQAANRKIFAEAKEFCESEKFPGELTEEICKLYPYKKGCKKFKQRYVYRNDRGRYAIPG